MDIKWVGASATNFGVGRAGHTINKIVLHWIVGTLESADATFNNPLRKASSHYGIGNGDIHQYVKEEDTAWHAGNLTVNRESIGIEHEGGWLLPDGTTRFKPTEQTLQTSAKLVAEICKKYNIPIDREHIKKHSEVTLTATYCPGLLDVDRIIELAKAVSSPPTTMPITDQTKILIGKKPDDSWWGDNGNVEVQAIRGIMNDQFRDNKAKDEKIKELEAQLQQPPAPVFSNPKAIHFFELAKLEEGV